MTTLLQHFILLSLILQSLPLFTPIEAQAQIRIDLTTTDGFLTFKQFKARKEAKPGDFLIYQNSQQGQEVQFEFVRMISSFGASDILEVINPKTQQPAILRLNHFYKKEDLEALIKSHPQPSHRQQYIEKMYNQKNSVKLTLKGLPQLEHFKVPTPKILDTNGRDYVLVEKMNIIKNMTDIDETYLQRLSPEDRNQLELQFLNFAKTTAPFSFISDFALVQIALTSKGFVLLDWMDKHYLVDEYPSQELHNTFELDPFIEQHPLIGPLMPEVRKVINKVRQQKGLYCPL